jgi:hypothetical protein
VTHLCVDAGSVEALLVDIDRVDMAAVPGKLNRVAATPAKGVDDDGISAPLRNVLGDALGRDAEPAFFVHDNACSEHKQA